jgi:hypothetical protein
MLWYSIFKSYMELYKRNILHRDIRAAKVFYTHRDQQVSILIFSIINLLILNLQERSMITMQMM